MAEEEENSVEEVEDEEICEEGAPGWVVTFGDMMSLLLTFFILLLSFATMDILRFIELAGTIKQGFGLPVKEQLVLIPKAENIVRLQPKIDFNAKKVMEELKRKLDPTSPTKRTAKVTIEIFQSYRGVMVLFPADDLFVPGTDRLRPQAGALLDIVAAQARSNAEFDLLIEVKSPENAPRAPKFPDVWSLTASQAVSINRYLRFEGGLDPGRLIATGRGPASATVKPGSTVTPGGSTVEFVFLSNVMKHRN